MFNVVHVPEMQGGDLLPQQGVGPDRGGGAVGEVAEVLGFGVVTPGLGVGVNWPNMKLRMLSSLPSLVTKSCRYLLNCCSTEEMLNSM